MHGGPGQRVREPEDPIKANEPPQLSGEQGSHAQPELPQAGQDDSRVGGVVRCQEGHGTLALDIEGAPSAGVAHLHGPVHRRW